MCFLCMLLVGGQVCARTHRKDMRMPAADDVMQRVFASAPDFSAEVGGYEARLYVKGVVRVKRKNFMLRYLPSMFKMNPREREYIATWFDTYQFDLSLIEYAYEITVERTGKLAFGYLNKILASWHQNGIRTIEEAKQESKPSSAAGVKPSGTGSELNRKILEQFMKD